jgi:hypothetical protein
MNKYKEQFIELFINNFLLLRKPSIQKNQILLHYFLSRANNNVTRLKSKHNQVAELGLT